MTRASVLLLLGLASLLAGCRVERMKREAKERFSEEAPALLEAAERRTIKLVARECERVRIRWDGGGVLVPKPRKRIDSGPDDPVQGAALHYDSVVLSLLLYEEEEQFGELPGSWGEDDFAKMRTVAAASGEIIDGAETAAEVEEAIALLAARVMIPPVGSLERADWLEGPELEGMLGGVMNPESVRMEFIGRSLAPRGCVVKCIFQRRDGGTREDVIDFLRAVRFEPEKPVADPLPDRPSR